MLDRKNIFIVFFSVILILVVICFFGRTEAATRNYDIRNEISTPEYKTDTARAIDAYERVMDRFMDQNQENLSALDSDIKQVLTTLNAIEIRLTQISERQLRIEKALGIEPTEKPQEQKEETKVEN